MKNVKKMTVSYILGVVCLIGCGNDESGTYVKDGLDTSSENDPNTDFKHDQNNIHYFFNVACNNWNVRLFINEQPVNICWGESQLRDVTRFIIQGRNKVRFVADLNQESTSSIKYIPELDLRFLKIMNPYDNKSIQSVTINRLYESNPDPELTYEKVFDCTSENGIRWTWQDSEDVLDFTEGDRKNIVSVINKIASFYREKNLEKIMSSQAHFWKGNDIPDFLIPPGINPIDVEKKQFNRITGFSDYSVIVAPQENIRFISGSKIALAYLEDNNPLIYAGHSKETKAKSGQIQINVRVSLKHMYFIKIKGQWRWLN